MLKPRGDSRDRSRSPPPFRRGDRGGDFRRRRDDHRYPHDRDRDYERRRPDDYHRR